VLIPLSTSSSTTFTLSFPPTEDTFITDITPDGNFGERSTLQADASPNIKRFLMRFHVNDIPADATVTASTLRFFTVNYSKNAGEVFNVGGDWSEASTTWTNAPPIAAKIGNIGGPAVVGFWNTSDVTAGVSGNGDVNFFVTSTSADAVYYTSSEGGTNGPVLSVQFTVPSSSPPPTDAPSPQPTPSPTAAVTPAPTPDTGSTGITPTPTPGSTPPPIGDPSFQPAAPIQAAFFYPWFPNAWNQGGVYPFSQFTPSDGLYSSTDDATIDRQITQASRAHMEAMISSWWGQGHHTDTAFKHILARSERSGSPAPNMRWTVYYEPEGYGDPTPDQIVSDLNYLSANYFSHPGFLRVNGKPVVFVWATGSDICGMADRWAQAKSQFGGNVHIVLKVFSGYATCASQPDSWHQYGPSSAYHQHLPHSVNVSPGFWHANEALPRLVRDPVRFESDVKKMAATSAFWHLVTSWSEWGEGTIVEPSTQFGELYIDILCRNLPGPAPCTGGTAVATPTPGPSAAPTPVATPTPAPTPAPTPGPTPPPPSGGDQVLVGAGDIVADCVAGSSTARAEATAKLLDAIPGTVFTAGDNVYEQGTLQQYTDCYGPTWGRHKARTKPVVGNHEYLTSGASGYYTYFGDLASPNQPGCVSGCTGYYAYNLGNWRVYSLNSSNVNKTTELAWLQADLAANPRQCSVAIYHHPTLTAGPHANDEGGMLAMWRALYDSKVDLVVNGHDHSYQRFAPLNRDSNGVDTANGMREIIVGTGGKNYTTQTRAGTTPGLEATSDGDTNPADGVLKLTLRATSYDWQFVPVAGKTFTDSGNQACH
jgi:hypothetical protein